MFESLAGRVIAKKRIDAIVETIEKIEKLDDIRILYRTARDRFTKRKKSQNRRIEVEWGKSHREDTGNSFDHRSDSSRRDHRDLHRSNLDARCNGNDGCLTVRSLSIPESRPNSSVAYIDHNTSSWVLKTPTTIYTSRALQPSTDFTFQDPETGSATKSI